ncbi:hypothetical protein K8T06_14725 [bacterium]|nr:hypothetical protein [bacterium]
MNFKKNQISRLRQFFLEGFSVMDVAEPLVSFDVTTDALKVQKFMTTSDYDLIGLRRDGLVSGYARREDLTVGVCGDHLRFFTAEDDLVPETANLIDAVNSLAINRQCFVTILDRVGAILTLSDLEKPPMRMFLFGLITIGEMLLTSVIRTRYKDSSWQTYISENRLKKARELQVERKRRGQIVDLVDCLQFGDKGLIVSYDEEIRISMGWESRSKARKEIKELESLRNNLAHTQDIIPTGWHRIVIACNRMEQNLEVIADKLIH